MLIIESYPLTRAADAVDAFLATAEFTGLAGRKRWTLRFAAAA
jgi:hypothetical protein